MPNTQTIHGNGNTGNTSGDNHVIVNITTYACEQRDTTPSVSQQSIRPINLKPLPIKNIWIALSGILSCMPALLQTVNQFLSHINHQLNVLVDLNLPEQILSQASLILITAFGSLLLVLAWRLKKSQSVPLPFNYHLMLTAKDGKLHLAKIQTQCEICGYAASVKNMALVCKRSPQSHRAKINLLLPESNKVQTITKQR